MKLIATKLTAQTQAKMLAEFCEAYGDEQIRASYGWEGEARGMMRNERSWTFGDPLLKTVMPIGPVIPVVGWGSIVLNTMDESDDEAALTVGVFPQYQRRGYRKAIIDWLCERAAKLGAEFASQIVRKANDVHYNRTMREAHETGNPWIYAGDVFFPAPGYGIFVRPLK